MQLVSSVLFVVDFLHHRRGAALALLGVPEVSDWLEKSSHREISWCTAVRVWLMGAFSFVLILASTVPGALALSNLPPERAEFFTHWILLITLLATGVLR